MGRDARVRRWVGRSDPSAEADVQTVVDRVAAPSGRLERPDVAMLVSVETFWRLVDGTCSPIEAYRAGKLRVHGPEGLG